MCFRRVGCLGMQPKTGGKLHLKLNTGTRPIANKYREGKIKRTLKRVKKCLKLLKGKRMELAIRPTRFSCSCSATRSPSIQMDETVAGAYNALLVGERQHCLAMGDKDPGKVDWPSRPVVKPRACTAQHRAWLCYHCDMCLTRDLHDLFGMSTVADGTPVCSKRCRSIGRCSHTIRSVVLTDCTKRPLVFLDIKIRGAVRRWLKLPKDISNFF